MSAGTGIPIIRWPFCISIRVPVLLVQATNDDISSTRNSKVIYEKIASPVKEILMLENSYHVVTVDQEWEKVAQGLNDFFVQRMGLAPKEHHELKTV